MDPKELRGLMEAYSEVYAPVDEATAMAKRGYDEAPIRQKIAKSTGGGEAADRATALADRQVFKGGGSARDTLARKQRGDFRNTTSSNPGLHGYAHKATNDADRAKQAARGAQRAVLTPAERARLNREEVEQVGEAVKGADTEMRSAAAAERRAGDKPLSKKVGDANAAHMARKVRFADKVTKAKGHMPGYTYGEEVEIFDVVLEFLQVEGYAETLEEAEWLMANVIDEEAISIVLGEAQEARNNPEKYEADQKKKYAPVRGERTPMPPRGDKRREDFEKWYAANVR